MRENVTQILSLEDYVAGVLRAENSVESEAEALKALAITIRTYALKNMGRHATNGYDFCSTTHCQRFVAQRPRVVVDRVAAAVRATEGQVLSKIMTNRSMHTSVHHVVARLQTSDICGE